MIKRVAFLLITALAMGSCQDNKTDRLADPAGTEDLAAFVNPFIGTRTMGHTFPGATAPFGMVQLSPETNQVPMHKAEIGRAHV